MHQHFVPISIAIAFALGCAATSVLTIPPAHAQSPARWEYLCIDNPWLKRDELHKKLNEAGAQGWELQTAHAFQHAELFCLKRPARSGAPAGATP
jgi:hypothetical protein